MRVAVVHSFYRAGQPSGENIAVEQQSQALARAGIEVVPIFRTTDDEASRRLYPVTSALRVATGWDSGHLDRVVNGLRPDIVHVHNTFPNFGTRWMTRLDAPVVLTLHNFRLSCANGLLFRDNHICLECPAHGSWRAFRHGCYQDSRLASVPAAIATAGGPTRNRLLDASSIAITQSRRVHDFLLDSGVPAEGLAYVPGFVERRSQGATPVPTPTRFVFVGRTSPEKGLDELIDLWPNDLSLEVIGSELDSDARPSGGVTYRGRLQRDRLIAELPSYTALIFPGLVWEGAYPLVVREALEAGVPVIAREGSGAADLVHESRAGVTYSGGDPKSLGEALTHVIDGNQVMRVAARRFFEGSLTEERWTSDVLDLYEQCLRE